MSLFSRSQPSAGDLIAERTGGRTGNVPVVTNNTALRHSAVWACLRLRADLISTMPIDAYRKVLGVQIEVTKPPVLLAPGGANVEIEEWMYSSQVDLDRAGNVFGIITAVDGLGLPARIELQDLSTVTVVIRSGVLAGYRIAGKFYEPHQVWHEKQFTLAGLHVGLSPVAYSAWSIGQYLSAQQFAMDWFSGGAIPAASLKNTAKTLNPKESTDIKQLFKATVSAGDVFVHGADWEYKPIQAEASGASFLATQQAGIPDIARFFGCPADLIDAMVSGSAVTYASISQRNLQLLVMNVGPAVTRRERALSRLIASGRFVKLNPGVLLRMDPETASRVIGQRVKDRLLAPSEARALDNLQPLTDEQIAEFDRLFGAPRAANTKRLED